MKFSIEIENFKRAIGFRGRLPLPYPPLLGLSLDCDGPFLQKEVKELQRSGGVAAIVCDTTENTVRQGGCLGQVKKISSEIEFFQARSPTISNEIQFFLSLAP